MKIIFAICLTLSVALGEVVRFDACANSSAVCDVHQVRVNPCKEAATNSRCKAKRGGNVNIAFDFEPKFEAGETFENEVFWLSPDGPLPWAGLERNACSFVNCPLKQNEINTYSYDVVIDRLAQPVSYT